MSSARLAGECAEVRTARVLPVRADAQARRGLAVRRRFAARSRERRGALSVDRGHAHSLLGGFLMMVIRGVAL
jgi:hypothetical protein